MSVSRCFLCDLGVLCGSCFFQILTTEGTEFTEETQKTAQSQEEWSHET